MSPDALVPGRGLPKPVVTAWKRGDTVVLLVVRQGGIDDRLVRNSVRSLSSDRGSGGVSVFVTRANHVARYSRITQGVGVSQAPALVVVRPKRVSGSVPEAQVDYGFRDCAGGSAGRPRCRLLRQGQPALQPQVRWYPHAGAA